MLAPCEPCLGILKMHMGTALAASSLTAEQGGRFVEKWNALRAELRSQMAETLRQAREWLEKNPPGPMPAADPIGEIAPETAPETADIAAETPDSPQVVHNPDGEKNHVTSRRARRKKALPDADVPKASAVEASGEEGAVASRPEVVTQQGATVIESEKEVSS
jgi:hypothetical protein